MAKLSSDAGEATHDGAIERQHRHHTQEGTEVSLTLLALPAKVDTLINLAMVIRLMAMPAALTSENPHWATNQSDQTGMALHLP